MDFKELDLKLAKYFEERGWVCMFNELEDKELGAFACKAIEGKNVVGLGISFVDEMSFSVYYTLGNIIGEKRRPEILRLINELNIESAYTKATLNGVTVAVAFINSIDTDDGLIGNLSFIEDQLFSGECFKIINKIFKHVKSIKVEAQ